MLKSAKSILRPLLNRFFNRSRLNDSKLYSIYTKIFLPESAERKEVQKKFYAELLGTSPKGIVFDIGANLGDKAHLFLPHATKVVCIEPNPSAAAHLFERFKFTPKVTLVQNAVSNSVGHAELISFGDANPYNTLSEKWANSLTDVGARTKKEIYERVLVPTTTLDALILAYGLPEFIKIDVEGFEAEVVKGLSRKIPLISMEFNFPEFKNEAMEAINRLVAIDAATVFNVVVTEPPRRFEARVWLTANELKYFIAVTKYNYVEIYARMGGA